MRKVPFIIGEYYHIFNRGVDKRVIFKDAYDFLRFLESMDKFNTTEPIGSIYNTQFNKLRHSMPKSEKLVDIIAYCLISNHFHLILTPLVESGISKFMHKLSMGYTNHFNLKNKRSGCLFQGKFKAIHIDTDEYLMHVSAYVNLNNKVHCSNYQKKYLYRSSWKEYLGKNKNQISCNKNIILKRFKKIEEYKKYAESSLEEILERRDSYKNFEN